MIFYSLFIFMISFASTRNEGMGDRPATCNKAALSQCLNENSNLRDLYKTKKDESQGTLDSIKEILNDLSIEQHSIDEKINIINLNFSLNEKEINFLSSSDQIKYNKLYGDVSIEMLFGIKEQDFFWEKNLDDSRLVQLNKFLLSLTDEKNQIVSSRLKIANEIESYQAQQQFEIASFGENSYLESTHAKMCELGCNQKFCAEN